jgi:hypothetical protein
VEPEVGFEPTTFRLRDGCSQSAWTAPDGSSLLATLWLNHNLPPELGDDPEQIAGEVAHYLF